MSDMSFIRHFICGSVGGIFYVLAIHPFDTMKVRMQILPCRCSLIPSFRNIVAKEGYLALYKGLYSALIIVVPNVALSCTGFAIGMHLFGPDLNEAHATYGEIFIAGCFAPFISTISVSPGEHVKCLMQIQEDYYSRKYTGHLDCVKKLYRVGGIAHLYKGVVPTMVRDIPAVGCSFLIYEALINRLTYHRARYPSKIEAAIAGGLSGMVYWIVAMPGDVVKTIYQTARRGKYKYGSMEVFLEVLAQDGIYGFFKGMTPIIITAAPSGAASYIGFEWCRRWLSERFPIDKGKDKENDKDNGRDNEKGKDEEKE